MKKNGFLTFCCACVPGFGQMYQGYMKRGISLSMWFWGTCGVIALFNLAVISFLLAVIWAYSFFDTFNIRNLSPEQRAIFPDEYFPTAEWLQKQGIKSGFLNGRGGHIAGMVLVGLGIYMLYANLVRPMLRRLLEYFPLLNGIVYNLPTVLVAIAVIGLGIWMLGKNRKSIAPSEPDDTTPFKGG